MEDRSRTRTGRILAAHAGTARHDAGPISAEARHPSLHANSLRERTVQGPIRDVGDGQANGQRRIEPMTKQRASIIVAQLLVSAALAFAIVSTVRIIIAHSEERATFTDRNGHFSGSSITNGPKTDFYDARGRYQ